MRLLQAASTAFASTTLLLGSALCSHEEASELVGLITLTRHGSRAPNPVTKQLCPNNINNLNAYKVPLEQLTHRGALQLEETGRYIREQYVLQDEFLNGTWGSLGEVYFRADAANRCFQSALAMGRGLYPEGGGGNDHPNQPVPVFMQLPQNEHDFTAVGPCWTIHSEHQHQYGITRGKELIDEHAAMLRQVEQICGAEFTSGTLGDDPVMAIKDVADMFRFDRDEGLPLTPGLTFELADAMTRLSFQQMIERLYATPREITYAIGGFPSLILHNFNDIIEGLHSNHQYTKYYSYHCHRELLHGLGFMLGMKFHFEDQPEVDGSTPLHPGSTLILELHQLPDAGDTRDYFINLFVWSPKTPRRKITLDKCDTDCPLPQFSSIIHDHLEKTGTWEQICGLPHNVWSANHEEFQPQDSAKDQIELAERQGVTAFGWAFATSLIMWFAAIGLLMLIRAHKHHGYQELD